MRNPDEIPELIAEAIESHADDIKYNRTGDGLKDAVRAEIELQFRRLAFAIRGIQ